ncbi:MAG: response regulator [Anaerolineales bacterium]
MPREILLVEDDPHQAEIFSFALGQTGLIVHHLKDGAEVLPFLKEHAPELVVLDLHLPNLRGDKILQALRANPATANCKVILATADPRLADRLQDQADLVLLKPISYQQLKELAKRLLAD